MNNSFLDVKNPISDEEYDPNYRPNCDIDTNLVINRKRTANSYESVRPAKVSIRRKPITVHPESTHSFQPNRSIKQESRSMKNEMLQSINYQQSSSVESTIQSFESIVNDLDTDRLSVDCGDYKPESIDDWQHGGSVYDRRSIRNQKSNSLSRPVSRSTPIDSMTPEQLMEYREKRNRNNEAVRKSRAKSKAKQEILEKECVRLEEELRYQTKRCADLKQELEFEKKKNEYMSEMVKKLQIDQSNQ